MHCLGGRVLKPEILDTLTEEEARASLADLIRINRRWGGHSALRRLLSETVQPGKSFSLLDVGAASGDMGSRIREWYPKARVVSLDRIATHLADCPGERIVGDAFRLPVREKSFDFVFSSLFLHHFDNFQVAGLLSEFGRVARRAVLAIDLERNPIAYYFLPCTRWLFGWDPVTVHDGAISVEAAFHARELEALARRAGLKNPHARAYRPAFRIGLVASSVGYNEPSTTEKLHGG
jgi:ubiquinone/menaquinone biosynthesis C-methylase UbiE